jgi:hypothetical protein
LSEVSHSMVPCLYIGNSIPGYRTDKNAWISEAYLRRIPEVHNDDNWPRSLSAMIELARPYGWVDEERKVIEAHMEWPEAGSAVE